MKREILLVDDERTILKSMSAVLTEGGYAVRTAENGDRAVAAVREKRPDLVLLDVSMPKRNGLEVCADLRRSDATLPVVFLTALDTPQDELRGLAAGGDLYVSKATDDEVLLARLAAIFRSRDAETAGGDFDFGPWRVESAKLMMSLADGRRETLTDREVAFLRMFSFHPEEVFSRDVIISRLWGTECVGSDNTLSLLVSRLRKKLGHAGDAILLVRGVGYAYRP